MASTRRVDGDIGKAFRMWTSPHHDEVRREKFGAATSPARRRGSGVPAISVPCGASPEGLPIGLQLVAGEGREHHLVALAALVERILPGGPSRSGRRRSPRSPSPAGG